MSEVLRIAMWSGPRNISTAMMRSWEQRADTIVCDEPLYAYYLKATGLDHPGREEVLVHHESDWRKVVQGLTGPLDGTCGRRVFYQKHMAHHLLPEIERDWLRRLTHCFLIREPQEMLASLLRIWPRGALADTGLPQQWELFQLESGRIGRPPPVVDARDLLKDPRGVLSLLCERLGLAFHESMLSWPPGRRATDGVWAKHWYSAVEKSTGFEPYQPRESEISDEYAPLLDECNRIYQALCRYRIR